MVYKVFTVAHGNMSPDMFILHFTFGQRPTQPLEYILTKYISAKPQMN